LISYNRYNIKYEKEQDTPFELISEEEPNNDPPIHQTIEAETEQETTQESQEKPKTEEYHDILEENTEEETSPEEEKESAAEEDRTQTKIYEFDVDKIKFENKPKYSGLTFKELKFENKHYSELTLKELKHECKEKGVTAYSKMNKTTMIEALSGMDSM